MLKMSGKVKLLPEGWDKLSNALAGINAAKIGVAPNTLRTIREKGLYYQTNLKDLEKIFKRLNLGLPKPNIDFQDVYIEIKPHLRAKEVAESHATFDDLPPSLHVELLPDWRNDVLLFAMGREVELSRLENGFKDPRTTRQAIAGIGGVGKTTLALMYIDRYGGQYDHCIFLNASSTEILKTEYIKLGRKVAPVSEEVSRAIKRHESSESDETSSNLVQSVRSWLAETPNWLIVFDNANFYDGSFAGYEGAYSLTQEALDQLLPTSSPGSHILLTTRKQSLKVRLRTRVLAVHELSEAAAEEFLIARANPIEAVSEKQRDAIRRLAEKLGYLPLALEQVAAYIGLTTQDFATYEQLYDKHPLTQLEQRGETLSPYPATLATTWNITFEWINHRDPAAIALFMLSSFLASQPIPFQVIVEAARGPLQILSCELAGLDDASVRCLDAETVVLCHGVLNSLHEWGLVRKDTDNRAYRIHSLMQLVQRESLSSEEQREWIGKALDVVSAAFPIIDPKSKLETEIRGTCDLLIPHILALANRIDAGDVAHYGELMANLLGRAANYLLHTGRRTEVEPLLNLGLQLRRKVWPEGHPDIAISQCELAEMYFLLARYDTAREFFDAAILSLGETPPENHALTYAAALDGIGVTSLIRGDIETGEAFITKSYEIRKRVLPPRHRLLAVSWSNLGHLYRDQGKHAEAVDACREELAILRENLPEVHGDIAVSLNNIAVYCTNLGEYAEAETLLYQAIELYSNLDALHGKGLAQANLARVSRLEKHYDLAFQRYDEAIHTLEKHLGEDHPHAQQVRGFRDVCFQESQQPG